MFDHSFTTDQTLRLVTERRQRMERDVAITRLRRDLRRERRSRRRR